LERRNKEKRKGKPKEGVGAKNKNELVSYA
jgi:hypothetical protein